MGHGTITQALAVPDETVFLVCASPVTRHRAVVGSTRRQRAASRTDMVSGGYRHAIDGGMRIEVDGRWMACVQFTNEEEGGSGFKVRKVLSGWASSLDLQHQQYNRQKRSQKETHTHTHTLVDSDEHWQLGCKEIMLQGNNYASGLLRSRYRNTITRPTPVCHFPSFRFASFA